jgi:hypothetical protein
VGAEAVEDILVWNKSSAVYNNETINEKTVIVKI